MATDKELYYRRTDNMLNRLEHAQGNAVLETTASKEARLLSGLHKSLADDIREFQSETTSSTEHPLNQYSSQVGVMQHSDSPNFMELQNPNPPQDPMIQQLPAPIVLQEEMDFQFGLPEGIEQALHAIELGNTTPTEDLMAPPEDKSKKEAIPSEQIPGAIAPFGIASREKFPEFKIQAETEEVPEGDQNEPPALEETVQNPESPKVDSDDALEPPAEEEHEETKDTEQAEEGEDQTDAPAQTESVDESEEPQVKKAPTKKGKKEKKEKKERREKREKKEKRSKKEKKHKREKKEKRQKKEKKEKKTKKQKEPVESTENEEEQVQNPEEDDTTPKEEKDDTMDTTEEAPIRTEDITPWQEDDGYEPTSDANEPSSRVVLVSIVKKKEDDGTEGKKKKKEKKKKSSNVKKTMVQSKIHADKGKPLSIDKTPKANAKGEGYENSDEEEGDDVQKDEDMSADEEGYSSDDAFVERDVEMEEAIKHERKLEESRRKWEMQGNGRSAELPAELVDDGCYEDYEEGDYRQILKDRMGLSDSDLASNSDDDEYAGSEGEEDIDNEEEEALLREAKEYAERDKELEVKRKEKEAARKAKLAQETPKEKPNTVAKGGSSKSKVQAEIEEQRLLMEALVNPEVVINNSSLGSLHKAVANKLKRWEDKYGIKLDYDQKAADDMLNGMVTIAYKVLTEKTKGEQHVISNISEKVHPGKGQEVIQQFKKTTERPRQQMEATREFYKESIKKLNAIYQTAGGSTQFPTLIAAIQLMVSMDYKEITIQHDNTMARCAITGREIQPANRAYMVCINTFWSPESSNNTRVNPYVFYVSQHPTEPKRREVYLDVLRAHISYYKLPWLITQRVLEFKNIPTPDGGTKSKFGSGESDYKKLKALIEDKNFMVDLVCEFVCLKNVVHKAVLAE